MSIKSVLKDFTLYDSDNLSGQVHKTYDYSIFRKMVGNRSLNLNHVKALKKSIQEDYIPNAIVVNQRMEVVDGQHRLQALSELNKPVYYRIIKDLDLLSVQRMNTKVRQWTMAEYLDSFCQRGFEDYIKLKEFMGMTGFCLDVCIALLLNKEVRTGNDRDKFVNGKFKIKDYNIALQQANQIQQTSEYLKKHYKEYAFCLAMLYYFHNEQYDHQVFMKKLSLQPSELTKQRTVEQYKRKIEEIYNFRTTSSNKIRFTF